MRRMLALLLVLLCLAGGAQASPRPLASLDEVPETTDEGFLPEGSDPVYYKNHAEGVWFYLSDRVRLEISRTRTKKPLLTYYLADIVCARGTALFTASWNQKKPGRSNGLPQEIARRDNIVYGQSGDFYSYRVSQGKYPGAIVRDGKVLYRKTANRAWARVPNLATMAFYPSGRAEVNEAWEVSAKEYVSRGATTVVSFGPILIRDGELCDLSSFESHQEPRSAIGIIEPGHYVGLLVEGRKNHSAGADLVTCAQLLYDFGCTDAINLDGGNTVAMLFMGESVQLSDTGGVDENTRAIPDLLCVGTY